MGLFPVRNSAIGSMGQFVFPFSCSRIGIVEEASQAEFSLPVGRKGSPGRYWLPLTSKTAP